MRSLILIACLASVASAELDPQKVRKVIKKRIRELGACFQTHGDVHARVAVDFTIRKDGKTAAVSAGGEGNKDLHGCIAGVFEKMQFPASSTETKVHYPVHIIVAGE